MLNLTAQEKQIILFLSAIAILGIGIDFFVKIRGISKPAAVFDQNIGKINLNQADKETLVIIPGIGEKLAERIIEYRSQNGDFSTIEDLRKIKGLTKTRFEKLKELVFIE